MSRAVVLSGCSGGGKSMLLAELHRRGFPIVDEPGRKVVREELRTGGHALPWTDPEEFARRCITIALADLTERAEREWTFFDRGLVDAAAALHHQTGLIGCAVDDLRRYHRRVFVVPPWPELYGGDAERQLGFDDAVAEYGRLVIAYERLGYSVVVVPKTTIEGRARFILSQLHLR